MNKQEAIEWLKSIRRTSIFEQVEAIDMAIDALQAKTDEENELKFYYVESIDDYWVGRRLDNFYYANWHEGLGFVWSHSRYLPWGEHIVDENTMWKEHTYPSEPIEMQFTEWIVGFVKKYFAEPKTDGVLEQVRWERDMALMTLEEHGIGLGQKPKTGWIPCSERLPEEFYVLCCDNHGEMIIANLFACDDSDTGFSAESEDCYMYNCVAWMPLPKPYRKDGDTE